MHTQLVIFDNDGVLIDSESLIKQAQLTAFASQGAHITAEWAYIHLQGLRASDVLKAVEHHTGVTINGPECLAVFKQTFDHLINTQLQPTPHILATLNGPLEGISKCVATSGNLEETYHKLAVTNLLPLFPKMSIFSGEQVPHGKPAPDLMLFAAQNMGVNPTSCVVVEDAPFGIQAAKAAGMYAIGYMGGSHVAHTNGLTPQHLEDAGADAIIFSHEELFSVIP